MPAPHWPRRRWLLRTGGAMLAAASGRVRAQFAQPGRTLRLLVGLPAGGGLDGQARSIAQALSAQTQLAVVVDNKPGASTMLAAQELMRAPPDGRTLMYAAATLFAQNPHTLEAVPYDPFRDFTPLLLATRGPLVLCLHHAMPAQSAGELAAWAREHPGQLAFANFGTGTNSHLFAAAFAQAAGAAVVHVPYKGSAEASRDLLAGRVQAFFDAAPAALRNAATGQVRLLGLAAPQRSALLPQLPTLAEQGIAGIDLVSWTAFVGPAGMAEDLVREIAAALAQALRSAPVRDFITAGGYEVVAEGPAALAAEIRASYDRWGALVRQLGLARRP